MQKTRISKFAAKQPARQFKRQNTTASQPARKDEVCLRRIRRAYDKFGVSFFQTQLLRAFSQKCFECNGWHSLINHSSKSKKIDIYTCDSRSLNYLFYQAFASILLPNDNGDHSASGSNYVLKTVSLISCALMFREYEIVVWSCLNDPFIFRKLQPTNKMKDIIKFKPIQHLVLTAMSVKYNLNQKEMRTQKETALHFESFMKTLLGVPEMAATSITSKSAFQWQSYKSLLDRLTPSTVNQRYDDLKSVVNSMTQKTSTDQKSSGYEGHDYNGIVCQLNMDSQKNFEASTNKKKRKESVKARKKIHNLGDHVDVSDVDDRDDSAFEQPSNAGKIIRILDLESVSITEQQSQQTQEKCGSQKKTCRATLKRKVKEQDQKQGSFKKLLLDKPTKQLVKLGQKKPDIHNQINDSLPQINHYGQQKIRTYKKTSSLVIDKNQCLEFSSSDESKGHDQKRPEPRTSSNNFDSRITLKTPSKTITSRKRRRTLEPSDIRTTQKNLKTIIAKYEQSCMKSKNSAQQSIVTSSNESSNSDDEDAYRDEQICPTTGKMCFKRKKLTAKFEQCITQAKTVASAKDDELLQATGVPKSDLAALSSHGANSSAQQQPQCNIANSSSMVRPKQSTLANKTAAGEAAEELETLDAAQSQQAQQQAMPTCSTSKSMMTPYQLLNMHLLQQEENLNTYAAAAAAPIVIRSPSPLPTIQQASSASLQQQKQQQILTASFQKNQQPRFHQIQQPPSEMISSQFQQPFQLQQIIQQHQQSILAPTASIPIFKSQSQGVVTNHQAQSSWPVPQYIVGSEAACQITGQIPTSSQRLRPQFLFVEHYLRVLIKKGDRLYLKGGLDAKTVPRKSLSLTINQSLPPSQEIKVNFQGKGHGHQQQIQYANTSNVVAAPRPPSSQLFYRGAVGGVSSLALPHTAAATNNIVAPQNTSNNLITSPNPRDVMNLSRLMLLNPVESTPYNLIGSRAAASADRLISRSYQQVTPPQQSPLSLQSSLLQRAQQLHQQYSCQILTPSPQPQMSSTMSQQQQQQFYPFIGGGNAIMMNRQQQSQMTSQNFIQQFAAAAAQKTNLLNTAAEPVVANNLLELLGRSSMDSNENNQLNNRSSLPAIRNNFMNHKNNSSASNNEACSANQKSSSVIQGQQQPQKQENNRYFD